MYTMCDDLDTEFDNIKSIPQPRYLYYIFEEFEDTKEVIRICESKKNIQHNGQKKKRKRTNNDLQEWLTKSWWRP